MAGQGKTLGLAAGALVVAGVLAVGAYWLLSEGPTTGTESPGPSGNVASTQAAATRPIRRPPAAELDATTIPAPSAETTAAWAAHEGALRRMPVAGTFKFQDLVPLSVQDALLSGGWNSAAGVADTLSRVTIEGSPLLWTVERTLETKAEGAEQKAGAVTLHGWDFSQKTQAGLCELILQVPPPSAKDRLWACEIVAKYGARSPREMVKYTQSQHGVCLIVTSHPQAKLINGDALFVSFGKDLRELKKDHPDEVQEYLSPALAAFQQGEVLAGLK